MKKWSCKHCRIEFDFSISEKANHSRWCEKNPKRKDYVLALLKRDNVAIMNEAREKAGIKNQFDDPNYIVSVETRKKISNARRGRKVTEETRKRMSEGARKSTHRRLMRHTQRYIKKNGEVVLMDSSWEIALAKRLDELKIEWIRPEPLKWTDSTNKERNYFSDFYLPKYDIYLDPKNKAAYLNQIEKINWFLENRANVKFLTTLDECLKFLP